MHQFFSDWYRQATLHFNSEELETRWKCVLAIAEKGSIENISDLVLFFTSSPQIEKQTLMHNWSKICKEEDTTFPMKDNENLLKILVGSALVHLLGSEENISTFCALAISCIHCHGLREDGPIQEVLKESTDFLNYQGSVIRDDITGEQKSRARFSNIKALQNQLVSPELHDINLMNNFESINENFEALEGMLSSIAQELRHLHESVTKLRDEARKAATELSRLSEKSINTALKEETDILWWLFGESSHELDVSWSQLDFPGACLVIGTELADKTQLLPGQPSINSFIRKALKSFDRGEVEKGFNIKDVVNSTPREWRKSQVEYLQELPHKKLTPILQAISLSLDEENTWHQRHSKLTGIPLEETLNPEDWSRQIYDEFLLYKASDVEDESSE